MHEVPEHRQENTRVLRLPDDAIDAISEQLLAGEIDLDPAFDDHHQAGNHEDVADRHLDPGAELAITQKRSPKVTAVMKHRDSEREHTCEELDKNGTTVCRDRV